MDRSKILSLAFPVHHVHMLHGKIMHSVKKKAPWSTLYPQAFSIVCSSIYCQLSLLLPHDCTSSFFHLSLLFCLGAVAEVVYITNWLGQCPEFKSYIGSSFNMSNGIHTLRAAHPFIVGTSQISGTLKKKKGSSLTHELQTEKLSPGFNEASNFPESQGI
ncbi:hypothetical protein KP509_06G057900 [Ceratopteris richardii]|uniref:Uncharacterized protein n=1 Tax=Ceratopteris richardii TaxID=49495 RepID=A0A8T2UT34_CERRI|nr:hypothetical protein KP509_06G057900 [Ceratopteris richardii]